MDNVTNDNMVLTKEMIQAQPGIYISNKNYCFLKIKQSGEMVFSDRIKEKNIDETVKEFIKLVESSSAIRAGKINQLMESASSELSTIEKAKLFDEMCGIYK